MTAQVLFLLIQIVMLEWVEDIAESSGHTYGSRRMKRALNTLGYPVSRDKTRKLMREAGVKARQLRRYKVTTNSNHKQPVFDNLLNREFDVAQPDQVYASDVTYIWTKEGWLYLAVVIDLCTRQVVGWSMSSRMKAKLVCDALQMAIWRRRPKAGLIHHSDRGSQYASKAFRRLLKAHGIRGSMSRKGDCWDTQFKITSNVQPNLTRAGIGEAALTLTCRLDTGVPRALPGPLPVT